MELPIEALLTAFRTALDAVRLVSRRRAEAAWLVGGPVRDLLLGRPLADLDVTVEGDGVAFARELAREIGGEVRTHDAFGTGEVTAPDGFRVDVATARTETYDAPAALPTVTPASLVDDLSRRDFTVNALAWALEPSGEADVIDLFGGIDDLERRTSRILHPDSFVDDPTRILRGVRLGARLGFRMDPETETQARKALDEGILESLSPDRLRRELRLLLDDPDVVVEGVRRLEELGFWSALDPDVRVEPETVERLVAAWRDLGDDVPLSTPLRLALGLDGCDRLTGAVEALQEAAVPSERYRALERLSDTELLVLAADDRDDIARAARWLFQEARGLELGVTGGDLVASGLPPGPWIGQALETVRDALLDREIEPSLTRKAALETARRLRTEATGSGGGSIAAMLMVLAIVLLGLPSLAGGQLSERSIIRFRLDCENDLGRKEVTLFGNGTVRLREQRPDEDELLYLGELDSQVLEGYLVRLDEEDLSETDRNPLSVEGPWVERCTLDLLPRGSDPEATQRFRVSRYQSLSLALSRVMAVGDELLEHVLSMAGPGLPFDYVPARGDRLERPDGVVFEVVRYTGDGTGLEMRGVDVPLTIYVPIGQLREVYSRLVERGRNWPGSDRPGGPP